VDGTDADVGGVSPTTNSKPPCRCSMSAAGTGGAAKRGWIVEKSGDPGESGQGRLVEQFLTQFLWPIRPKLKRRRADESFESGAAPGCWCRAYRITADELATWAVRTAGFAGCRYAWRSVATSARAGRNR